MAGAARVRPALRNGVLAGAVVFLTLIGTGTATALWSTTESVDPFTADAATVGVSHTVGTGLTHTYTDGNLTAAQAVTVTNTGNREAAFTVTVSAASATDLLAHVSARLAVVADSSTCTPGAALPWTITGTLTSPVTLTSAPGALASGASAIVCVHTGMSTVSGHAGKSLDGTIVSTTIASPQAGWMAQTTEFAFAQDVAAPPTPQQVTTNAWFWIRKASDPSKCLETKDYGVVVWLGDSCGDDSNWGANWNELWRFVDTGDGYRVSSFEWEGNGWPQQTPFWVAGNGNGSAVTVGTSGQRDRWVPIYHSDGSVSFRAPDNPTRCVTLSGSDVLSTNSSCSATDENQKFILDMLWTVTPPPVVLTCDGNPSWMVNGWPQITAYEKLVTHRVLLDGVVVPMGAYSRATGDDPFVQFNDSNSELHAFLALYGYGPKLLTVEHSVMGGPWTLTGTRTISLNHDNPPGLQCIP